MGKQALVAGLALAGLAAIAVKAGSSLVLWGCLGSITLIAVVSIVAMGFHGHKHPLEATLEGGEIVARQHLKHELAAKGVDQFPTDSPVLEGIGQRLIESQQDRRTEATGSEPSKESGLGDES